jgi:RNA polymerase sigma factor (sigma-70 family)
MTMASLDDPADCDRWGPMEVPEPSNGPEENLLEKEMKSQMDRAVKGLPKSLRAVVEARQSPDTTIREIAMMVGISTTAAKSRLSRARHMLRKAVRPE